MSNVAKSLNKRIDTWARGQVTSGIAATNILLDAGDHAFATGDWTCLSRFMGKAQSVMRPRIKAVARKAFGIGIVEDAKQPTGFRCIVPKPENRGNGAERAKLATFAQDKVPLGGDVIKAWLGETDAPKAETPLKARLAGATVKDMIDGKITQSQASALLRELADGIDAMPPEMLKGKAKACVAKLAPAPGEGETAQAA